MNYEPVIGLEVHVELNTKSKMFCGCSADYFGQKPNTHTCPVCLGLPGALPYINKQAIEGCIKIGLALNCEISGVSLFERKNYFYPDLPKGYQLSQYKWPLCINGKLKIEGGRWIRINRVHQEEDTGKLFHIGDGTQIDFNRSGVPLVEVVTEPDFHDSSEVRDFAKKLQLLFRYLGVSNADMERGDMRLEANVSVRKLASYLSSGNTKLPDYRVELKNINSFRFMVAAIEYEIKRQIEALERGEKLTQETRGWNENKKQTYLQRSKEEAHDYRYFPDPDLPEINLQSSAISLQQLKDKMPELPWEKQAKFMEKYGLSVQQASTLIELREYAVFAENVIEGGIKNNFDPKEVANLLVNKKEYLLGKFTEKQILDDLKSKKENIISDEDKLAKLAEEVIEENPKSAEDYKSGKLAALNVLLGVVMRKSQGKADAVKVREILESLLNM